MYKIAAIGGDGIGPEIVAEGKKVLEAAGEKFNFDIQWTDFDIGADRYLATKQLLTEDDLTHTFADREFRSAFDDRLSHFLAELLQRDAEAEAIRVMPMGSSTLRRR